MTHFPTSERSYLSIGAVFTRDDQRRGHAQGLSLQRHIEAVHDGQVDPNCRACNEIQKKMEAHQK